QRNPDAQEGPSVYQGFADVSLLQRAHVFAGGPEKRRLEGFCERVCAPACKHPADHAPRSLPLGKILDANQARSSGWCSRRWLDAAGRKLPGRIRLERSIEAISSCGPR